jgi:hypothetical protein
LLVRPVAAAESGPLRGGGERDPSSDGKRERADPITLDELLARKVSVV